MRSNIFGNVILGSNFIGQGSTNAVDGTRRTTLRKLVAVYVRGLALRLGDWRALALKRAAGTTADHAFGMVPGWCPTPAMAVCAIHSPSRRQRHERWMSGVVVDPGTVGVR